MADTDNTGITAPTWLKAAGVALILVLGFAGVVTNDDDPATADPDSGLPQGVAWGNCKDQVKALLNNPATADFALTSTTITETSNGYDIDGALTAENDYGVEQEIAFSCNVWPDGETEAEVSSQ